MWFTRPWEYSVAKRTDTRKTDGADEDDVEKRWLKGGRTEGLHFSKAQKQGKLAYGITNQNRRGD